MSYKALIISLKGTKLSSDEKVILSKEKPWGVILFKRNLKSFDQIKKLISTIKKSTKNKRFPILIDEEGDTVSRLGNIINHNISANFFGNLYNVNKKICFNMYKNYICSVCKFLKELGININTIPVLDVLRVNTNKVIGNRAFSKNKKIVKELGELTIQYLHSHKIAGVIKHIPGHGASRVDSHKKLPKVNLSLKNLSNIDFFPFKLSKAKFAMTAHISYSKIDKNNPATFSKRIVKDIIRKRLKFKGILISDDISMKALKYNLVTNAKKSLEAGCNLVLYCAGRTNENLRLIKSLPYIDKFTAKKNSEFFNFLR